MRRDEAASASASHGPWYFGYLRPEKVYPVSGFSQSFLQLPQKRSVFVRDCAWNSNYAPAQPCLFCSDLCYVDIVLPKCSTQGFLPL